MTKTLLGAFFLAVITGLCVLTGAPAQAEESVAAPIVVTIENHVFQPTEIHFPANTKTEIRVKNLDTSAEEFESPGLKVEKVVPAKSEAVIRIKPLAHGRYTFVGEYHEKTARGVAVVE